MRILAWILLLSLLFVIPVSALDITAPTVPKSAQHMMPSPRESFGAGLLEVLRDALMYFRPDIREASSVCLAVIAAVMLTTLVGAFSEGSAKLVRLAGAVAIAAVLLGSTHSLIPLGMQTVTELSEYGKLLIPVMGTALAAQGGVTASAALCSAAVMFSAILTGLIKRLLIPMIYLFLALAAANGALGADILGKLRDGMKWLMTWLLKTVLTVFTGFIGLTGVVSGTTDAAALKAAKMTISSVVPVVGGILADASEAVLVSAGTVKNAAGIYGMFALLAIWLGPFLKIAAHYLLLKGTAAVCGIFAGEEISGLIGDFSSAMGLLLAITAAVCLMLLISVMCFLKGVG